MLVAISVKAPSHREVVLKVIEAKKDCFVEWPVGKSRAETREIRDAVSKEGARGLVGLHIRRLLIRCVGLFLTGRLRLVLTMYCSWSRLKKSLKVGRLGLFFRPTCTSSLEPSSP